MSADHLIGASPAQLPALPEGKQAGAALLPAVWKLLRLRWRITVNSFRHARRAAKVGTVVGVLGLLVLAGFIFWLSWMLLNFLRSPFLAEYVGDPGAFTDAMPALIFAGLFLGILLTSFGVLLQALYLSGDMDFLLAAPVPIRAVFITKMLQAVLPTLGLIALFGLPVLFGLGVSSGYTFLYYPLVLVMMLALTLAAAGIAGLLVMLVVRVFPARRVVEVLGFLGAILSIVCSQSGNLVNYLSRDTEVSNTQVSGALGLLAQLSHPWFPLNWPGRGLTALGQGQWLTGLGLTLLSLGLAGGVFWVSLVTAESWYYTGWAGMQVIAQKKRPAPAPRPASGAVPALRPLSWVVRLLSAPVRGLIWKDALVLRRDLRHLSQLITPLIFGVIYGFMFLRSGGLPEGGSEAPEWLTASFESLVSFGSIGLSLFVGWLLIQRLGGMGFSQEGKNYWLLKTAPISPRQMLTAKFLVAYLPALGLGALFLLVFSLLQGTPVDKVAYSLLVIGLCQSGMAGIELAFGAAGANFTWEDPRKMNAGNLGCLGMILTVIYLPVNLGFFLGPLLLAAVLGLPLLYGYLPGGILGVGLGLICTLLPLRLAEGRVARLGES